MVVCVVCIIGTEGGDALPPVDSSHFVQHLIHLVCVDPSIHPTDAILSHLPEVVFEGRDQGIIGDPLPEASCLLNVGKGDTVHRFVVVDPQGGIPGLVVCPTVERGAGHVSFVCCVYCRPCSAAVAVPRVSSPTVTLCPSAVVVFGGEVIVKIPIEIHGSSCPSREGGERGTVAELPIVEILCHEEVGGFQRSFVCHVPIISMGWGRSVHHVVHFVCWHTGDGVTADLLRVWTPLLNRLIHYSIVLTISTFRCFALTFFPKEDDRMAGRFVKVDLNFVERKVAFG